MTRIAPMLIGLLLLVRLPSLAQPMGPDQGLYAYVGERILHGDLAYRDAWDQKPPGVHYVYAALRAISKRDVVVPAADLAAAACVAFLLWRIGTQLNGSVAGAVSAVLFLLLSDPYLARYGGVRVRGQAETFIALAVTGAVAGALGARGARGAQGARGVWGAWGALGAGVLLGAAFALKYNAGLYGLVVLLALNARPQGRAHGWRVIASVILGAAIIPVLLFLRFWAGGALDDLYQATIAYNVRYSGETYASRSDMLRYVFVAPIRHAQVDPLWFVGGVGCIILLVVELRALGRRSLGGGGWIPLSWVGLACVSIAVNGARDLPQYFIQAAPALALAAGVAASLTMPRLPIAARWVVVALLAAATWRVGSDPFPKLAGNVWHDTQYLRGRIDRRTHLAKYGARDMDKFSALGNRDVGDFLGAHTKPDETVYVFGFSPGSYVYADRRSASRFFWSRPVILDFNRDDPRYGPSGLRADLERNPPAYVALQQHDWSPDVPDSAPFFHSQPALEDFLRANYHRLDTFVAGFEGWERNGR